jgi:protein SCO1/2
MNDIKDPQAAESWHFLTAPQETITAVTDAIGFRYYYDEKTEQFAHAAAVILMTPEGRVSRYLFGNNFQPQDVSLALTEASNGRIGGIVQQVLLLCFQYDATMGRYSLAVFTLIRAGGIIVLLGMSIFILRSLWGEKKSASVGGLAQQTARPSLLRRDAESAPVMPTTQQPASGSEKV